MFIALIIIFYHDTTKNEIILVFPMEMDFQLIQWIFYQRRWLLKLQLSANLYDDFRGNIGETGLFYGHNNLCRCVDDIQMFGVNMTFISSSEVKKCIFHECRRHE